MNDLTIAQKYVSKAQNAKARNLSFDLSFTSFKNLMMAKRCFYTKAILTDYDSTIGNRPTDRTIDRLDCNLGYVKGNVVACCSVANQLKASMETSGIDCSSMIKIIKKSKNKIKGNKK